MILYVSQHDYVSHDLCTYHMIESISSSLFNDNFVSSIVSKEFEKISSSPEGMRYIHISDIMCVYHVMHMVITGLQLSIMGVDMNEFNCTMMAYVRELLQDVKPLVSNDIIILCDILVFTPTC